MNEQKTYRKVTDLEEIQAMLYDLMQELHKICEEHGLVYNLFGGSLLGAVRHEGMIPWDDDIDVTMPRPDYEKLIRILKNNQNGNCCIYIENDKNYVYPFAKFCRRDTILVEKTIRDKFSKIKLYVDIFPLDGIPETTELEIKKMYLRAKKYKFLHNVSVAKLTVSPTWWKKPFVIYRWLRRSVLGICGYKFYLNKQIKITRSHLFEGCCNIGFVSQWVYGEKSIISKVNYYDRKLYKFGNYEFWGVKDSDAVLKKLYGDYITPPPKDQRKSHHNFELYIEKKN